MKALTAGSERKLTDHETEELSHDKWQSLVYNQRSLMFRDGCVIAALWNEQNLSNQAKVFPLYCISPLV